MCDLINKAISFRRRQLTTGGLSESLWMDSEERTGRVAEVLKEAEEFGRVGHWLLIDVLDSYDGPKLPPIQYQVVVFTVEITGIED